VPIRLFFDIIDVQNLLL